MKRWKRSRRKLKGLGDAVALVTQPVAGVIDKALGTSLKTCKGCSQRQEALNRRFPFSHNL